MAQALAPHQKYKWTISFDMLTFTIDDTMVKKKLNKVVKGFSDYTKAFDNAGKDLLGFYSKDVFNSQGKDAGEAWRGLSSATLFMRANRRGYYKQSPKTTNKILIWTGRLQDGFKKEVRKDRLRIYNTVPYFKYHQSGSGKAPQRRMLAISNKVVEKVEKAFLEYVLTTVK